jgi:hypothetical protein
VPGGSLSSCGVCGVLISLSTLRAEARSGVRGHTPSPLSVVKGCVVIVYQEPKKRRGKIS